MRLLPLFVVALAALPSLPLHAEDITPDPAGIALPAIRVTRIGERDLVDRLIVTGLIAAVEEIQVQPLIEGQPIEALHADVGDYVETGAVLAVLSSSTLDLQKSQSLAGLAQAKASMAQAQAQLIEAGAARDEAQRVAGRTARLQAQGSATGAAADSANAALLAAEARVDVAREALAAARAQGDLAAAQLANVELMLTRTGVKAPYAGRIIARNATIGAVASAAGQPLFVLEKEGALELRADVPETGIARLRPGQEVRLRLAAFADPLPGRLRLTEPAIDPLTRQGRARISLEPYAGLKAGMFAEATITLAEARLIAVPLSALGKLPGGDGTGAEASGQDMVLRVRDGLVETVPVTVLLRDGGFAGLATADPASGALQSGDLVIEKAGAFVRPGDKITPVLAADQTEDGAQSGAGAKAAGKAAKGAEAGSKDGASNTSPDGAAQESEDGADARSLPPTAPEKAAAPASPAQTL